MQKYLIIICVLSGFAFASQFLTNGDFEQPLTIGWHDSLYGTNSSINRATHYDPDPDYEAYAYKGTGDGSTKLYQTVDVLTTDLEFSINAKLYAWSNSSICWAGAAIVIAYLNETNALLGETMICDRSYACPWTNSSTRHLIEVTDSLWHNYAFEIDAELVNLSGINPANVKRIQVSLFGRTDSG
jgi:hypothetical protein